MRAIFFTMQRQATTSIHSQSNTSSLLILLHNTTNKHRPVLHVSFNTYRWRCQRHNKRKGSNAAQQSNNIQHAREPKCHQHHQHHQQQQWTYGRQHTATTKKNRKCSRRRDRKECCKTSQVRKWNKSYCQCVCVCQYSIIYSRFDTILFVSRINVV